MLNEVKLIGNAGADPEIRAMNNGDEVATLSIATSEKWTDKGTGEKKEHTEWHRVVVFGPLVNVIKQYVKKGSQIYVCGQLRTRKWQDNNGQDRWSTEVVLSGFNAKLLLLGGGNGGGARDYSSYQGGAGAGSGGSAGNAGQSGSGFGGQSSAFDNDLDDDVPF